MLIRVNDRHMPRYVTEKIGNQEIEMKKKDTIIMFAHNGKGFDSYHFLNNPYLSDPNMFKFTSLIKNSSGILMLEIEMPNCIVWL